MSDPLTVSIRLLNSLAIKLKQKRIAAGALSLSSAELKIHLDSSESAEPIDVEQKQQFETNSLVEEFMLLANISVAEKIQETYPATAVLRRHAPPPKTNFEVLQDILAKRRGLALDVSSSGALANSLDQCVDDDEPEFNTLVRIMATRCMLAAEYFCSGSVSKEAYGHYGLASKIYTHFTVRRSPTLRMESLPFSCQTDLIVADSPICGCIGSPTTCSRDQLHSSPSVPAVESTCGTSSAKCQQTTSSRADGRKGQRGVLRGLGSQSSREQEKREQR